MRFVVRAPATVANLGAGFDCLALALDVANEFQVDTSSDPGVEVEGEGAADLMDPDRNLVLVAMRRRAAAAGRELPEFRLRCRNRIPLERGLGSSASAAVAGMMLADELLGTPSEAVELLAPAVELEGHADNVAACLLGGVAVAYMEEDEWRAVRFEPDPDLRPVALIPEDERLSTDEARRVLPQAVTLVDATFNISRSALAVLALTSRPDLLGAALDDRLHQEARLRLVPEAHRVFEELRAAGVPVCVAGSGPSLLAFETGGRPVPDPGVGWRVLRAGLAAAGARLTSG